MLRVLFRRQPKISQQATASINTIKPKNNQSPINRHGTRRSKPTTAEAIRVAILFFMEPESLFAPCVFCGCSVTTGVSFLTVFAIYCAKPPIPFIIFIDTFSKFFFVKIRPWCFRENKFRIR